MMRFVSHGGFTLVEALLAGVALAVAIAAILGAYIGQITLNEHSRNLSLAAQDANRVMEQLRLQNSPCAGTSPSASVPAATGVGTCTAPITSWNDWLQRCGGGKSVQPNPTVNELITLTCQNRAGTVTPCPANENPIRATVAVCWRHRNRTIGECTWNGANLVADENVVVAADTPNVIDSPVMLTTLVTCR